MSKAFKKLAVILSFVSVLSIGAFGLAACNSDSEDEEDVNDNIEQEDNTTVTQIEGATIYERTESSLLEMDDFPGNLLLNGMASDSYGILPYDNWGTGKFSSISHTFRLTIVDDDNGYIIGFSDEEDESNVVATTAISSTGSVSLPDGTELKDYTDHANGENNVKTLMEQYGSQCVPNADDLHNYNYKFELITYLKGNKLSDGYSGEGYAYYCWYGVLSSTTSGEDYNLGIVQFAEYYVTGTLACNNADDSSHTCIVPDAGYYINSSMNENIFPFCRHYGGTDATSFYLFAGHLTMQYINKVQVWVDDSTYTITQFDWTAFSSSVDSSDEDEDTGTELYWSSSSIGGDYTSFTVDEEDNTVAYLTISVGDVAQLSPISVTGDSRFSVSSTIDNADDAIASIITARFVSVGPNNAFQIEGVSEGTITVTFYDSSEIYSIQLTITVV